MKPKRIILVRHGQSVGNASKELYESTPDHALKLTVQGRHEAFDAGLEIRDLIGDESVYVYVSPYVRTRETLTEIDRTIGSNIKTVRQDPRIREQDWGHLRAVDVNEEINKKRDEYGTFFYRIPDGESGADVYDRVSTFLDTMHRDFEKLDFPDNVLIVSHGLTIRAFLMRWFNWTVHYFEGLRNIPNAGVIVMELRPSRDPRQKSKYALVTQLKRHERE
jgi:broad specificity phosphatase PhoE